MHDWSDTEICFSKDILKLPSQYTLKDYTHFTKAAPGFSVAVDKQSMSAINMRSCPDHHKYVLILMDEMHIKEDLVYDKHAGMHM